MDSEIVRCDWVSSDPLCMDYHDGEWGVPLHDDRKHFEFLLLDGAQEGLSWMTILRKRENYRKAFDDFVPAKVARYTSRRVEKLLQNPGIIRNRLKVESAINNAKAFLEVQEELGSFDDYIWQFVSSKTVQNRWRTWREIPSETAESQAMSKDLRHRGFTFVGPTICYAYIQAAGMVNDHTVDCFRYAGCG